MLVAELKYVHLKTWKDRKSMFGNALTWLIPLDFGQSMEFGSFNLEQYLKLQIASSPLLIHHNVQVEKTIPLWLNKSQMNLYAVMIQAKVSS